MSSIDIKDKSVSRLPDGPKLVNSYHCVGCTNIKSLVGAPEQVDNLFDAANCTSLVSLEGAPKMHLGSNSRGGRFSVENCINLESLEHCPRDLDILNVQGCKKLKTLKGCPVSANGFWLAGSGITSLEGCPDTLQHLDISFCKDLKDLTGCTQELNSLKAHNAGLVTLAGAPEVNGECDLSECEELVSLQGLPERLRGSLDLGGCKKLTALVGAPKTVMGFVRLTDTGLTSLKGIGSDYLLTIVNELSLHNVGIKSHALGLLLIKGLKQLQGDFPGSDIIKRYIKARKLGNSTSTISDVIDCQHELIEAGFEDIAQL